ncbi:hypothetical protein PO181_05185 [Leuconostoc suionicum]|uniref:DUF6625 family protein n=1 Tax=Leuconostoc suionicum TaxID=1511761 RepID=UPI00233F651F|nr:DUF6625 family protein [Leuconostoc suionicum]MDC2816374.1 hypothetical protein [Leuconostoc suionicum]
MTNKLLIMPYYGNFPNYFQLWLDRIKCNPNIDLLLITDNDLSEYNISAKNIVVMRKRLQTLREEISNVVGEQVNLKLGYKVKDYFPLYGEIFSKFITDGAYEWWGTIDTDVLLGNTEKFLNDIDLEGVDRILGSGHLSFFRNTALLNTMWRDSRQENYADIIPFRYIRKFNQVAAYNEYGWKWGKGFSTFMEKIGLKIKNNFPKADLDFNVCEFLVRKANNDKMLIPKIIVNQSGMFMEDAYGSLTEIMYVHLQKRKMCIDESLPKETSKFDIVPNALITTGRKLSNKDLEKMNLEFYHNRNKRIWQTRYHNLFSDYIVLRLLMVIRRFKETT